MSGFKLINGQYVIDKSPEARLDYGVRMYKWLVPGDTINTSIPPVWTLSTGLTLVSTGVSADKQTAFIELEGGTVNDPNDPEAGLEWAQCLWYTTQGRREVQTLYFNMVDK